MKQNLLDRVEKLTLYTGSNGKKKCNCSCIGCSQERYGNSKKNYQGNEEQIRQILKLLPNLKNAYILGNPDVSVDANFCNKAAKIFVEKGIKVMFSTSGYNAVEIIKKLTDGIEPNNINYVSYSIDTLDTKKLKYLKGSNRINLEKIEEAIKYCQQEGIQVKIQPTLWEDNQDDYQEIIEYFYNKYNIKWYTFHIGSLEGIENKNIPIKHISPEKYLEIFNKLQKIEKQHKLKICVPKVFVEKEEFQKYLKNYKKLCIHGGKDMQIWIEKDGLKGTFCPIASEIMPDIMTFDLEKEEIKLNKTNKCLVCKEGLNEELIDNSIDKKGCKFIIDNKEVYNVCRFYK